MNGFQADLAALVAKHADGFAAEEAKRKQPLTSFSAGNVSVHGKGFLFTYWLKKLPPEKQA